MAVASGFVFAGSALKKKRFGVRIRRVLRRVESVPAGHERARERHASADVRERVRVPVGARRGRRAALKLASLQCTLRSIVFFSFRDHECLGSSRRPLEDNDAPSWPRHSFPRGLGRWPATSRSRRARPASPRSRRRPLARDRLKLPDARGARLDRSSRVPPRETMSKRTTTERRPLPTSWNSSAGA